MTSPTRLAAPDLASRVRRRELSAREVADAHLARAQAVEPRIRAFLDLDPQDVRAQADTVDARVRAGESLPLAGVPVAVKDNLCAAGRPTTAGSRILAGWRPPSDATVVRRLREAGAIVLGKTSCDEFAMGSSTERCAFGPTANPWNPERVPGGSSGGSAAAVAAGVVPLALGSDTGGSIRQPAAFCGVVGLKPTYGLVSRLGLVAFASSLDQVGPLARSVDEAALALSVIGGPDPADATCSPAPMPDLASLSPPKRFRVGVPAEARGAGVAPDVANGIDGAIAALEAAGGECVEIELPHARAGVAVYYVVACAEASSNLARYDGVRFGHRAKEAASLRDMIERTRTEGFGPEVLRRILLGTFVLSAGFHDAYYGRATRVRSLIARDFDLAFDSCDVVLTPTAPTTAFALGARLADPLAMYLSDVFTVPASLAGLPGISLPCGLGDDGLPVGVQLVGRRFGDAPLLAIARLLEDALGFRRRHAPPD